MTDCNHSECEFVDGWKLIVIIALISSCVGPSDGDVDRVEKDIQKLEQRLDELERRGGRR